MTCRRCRHLWCGCRRLIDRVLRTGCRRESCRLNDALDVFVVIIIIIDDVLSQIFTTFLQIRTFVRNLSTNSGETAVERRRSVLKGLDQRYGHCLRGFEEIENLLVIEGNDGN